MNEEQIKQNAEEYLKQIPYYGELLSPMTLQTIKEAYADGAHSRDEEIRQLHDVINDYSETIDKLRNPWISVGDGLPPIKTRVLFLDNNGKVWLGKNTISGYAELESDKPEILPPPTVPTCKPIITHWMPIPQLKKGGEK